MPSALAIVGLASMVFSPLSAWSDSAAPVSPRSVTLGHILEDDLRSLPYECECEFFAGPTRGGNTVFATRKNRAIDEERTFKRTPFALSVIVSAIRRARTQT